jgi:hypothetical protein
MTKIARCPEHGLHGERTECYVCGGPVEQVEMVPAYEYEHLRQAAWWVVMNWDLSHTQHASMPALRRLLGLPGEPPTHEEAQARLDAYLADPKAWSEPPLPPR